MGSAISALTGGKTTTSGGSAGGAIQRFISTPVVNKPRTSSVNPNQFNDIASLTHALHTKQITVPQYLARSKTIIQQGSKPTNTANILSKVRAYGAGAAYNAVVQPVVDAAKSTEKKAVSQFKYLSSPTSTQKQRSSIISNQTAAKNNPQYQAALKVLGKGRQQGTVAGGVKAQQLASKGASKKTLVDFMKRDIQKGQNLEKTGLSNLATLGTVYGGGDIIGAKTLRTVLGKDDAVNNLIRTTKLTQALHEARTGLPVPRSAMDHLKAPEPVETPKAIKLTSQPPKTAQETSVAVEKAPQPVVGDKISGSALRTEQRAVQAGMKDEFAGKTTYKGVSHKEEAANAVKLAHEDPEKAFNIAMGRVSGNNASHEAAVYHAVANNALDEAKKTGDFSRVQELASSPRHQAVSEAAQKLGAEGYNVKPNDPIAIMNDVARIRQTKVLKRAGTSLDKEAANISTAVKANTLKVSRQDWHSFVNDLRCK